MEILVSKRMEASEDEPIQQMPIYCPPNWDQIWYDWNDVGHDYEEPLEPNSPLSANQLKQVYWYANKHGKVKDVRFHSTY